MAERAANLAGKLVFDRLLAGVIPLQVVVTIGEIDVILVKDSSPLEGCSYATSA
jgi:hypothetical protein